MFLGGSHDRPAGTPDSLEPIRTAGTFAERVSAFQLVYRTYLQSGLGARNIFEMRITPFQLLETSQIFIATERESAPISHVPPRQAFLSGDGLDRRPAPSPDAVIATVTLVGDGKLGLPIESMFGEEVEEMRRQGRQLAEVASLADAVSGPQKFLQTFTQLNRVMAQFSRQQGVQNLLASVHPRHAKFYRRYFGFRPLSSRVAGCPHVENSPAVGLNLDFELYDREKPKSWYEIFGTPVPREKLRPCPVPPAEVQVLQEVARASSEQPLLPLPETCSLAPRRIHSAA